MTSREFYQKYASIFEQEYSIKICSADELDDLLSFISQYWSREHALVRSRVLLDWQHFDKENNRYNFVIARSLKTQELHAILGFIPATHYSRKVKRDVIWGALWKAREDVAMPGIGVGVMGFLCKAYPTTPLLGFGLSDEAWKLYKHYGAITGHVSRYYILHPDKQEFTLCRLKDCSSRCGRTDSQCECTLTPCDIAEYICLPDILFSACVPYKDRDYYLNRYLRHPIYTYHAFHVENKTNGAQGLIIWRFCEHEGKRCIRIVDYAGEIRALIGVAGKISEMLREYDAEFIDFILFGFGKQILLQAGFLDAADTDNVLANYFEPFTMEGINTRFFCCQQGDPVPVFIFKGDADQDRPNIIEEELG